jgi:copper chaperone CopZ
MKNSKNITIALMMIFGLLISLQGQAQDKGIEKTVTKYKVGFHCAGGKAKIETALSKVEGVLSYTVDLDSKMVKVEFNKAILTKEQVGKIFLDLGYSVDGKESKVEHKCDGGHDHKEGDHKH